MPEAPLLKAESAGTQTGKSPLGLLTDGVAEELFQPGILGRGSTLFLSQSFQGWVCANKGRWQVLMHLDVPP
jgi:hypothetical protein